MPEKTLQLAVIDTETTGLSPARHEMIEVGIIHFEQWYSDGVTYARKWGENSIKMLPVDLASADPIALKINGYSKEKWANAVPHKDGLNRARELLSVFPAQEQKINELILVGHNIHFDVSFLIESFRRHDVDFEMNKRAIDTYSVAVNTIGRQNQKSFSLGSLCERFGIEYNDRHTALGDARATFELYKKLFSITEPLDNDFNKKIFNSTETT